MREVFDPSKRPWIDPQGSTTEKIIQQVRKCPSGALNYYMNDDSIEKDVIAEFEEKRGTYSKNHPTFVLLNNQITDMVATAADEKTIRITARFFLLLRVLEPELS